MGNDHQMVIEKLKGRENYSIWKVGAKANLVTRNHWQYVEEQLAVDASAEKKLGDAKTLAEITLMVDSNIYTYLQDCNTAKEGWDALVSAFEDKGVTRKVALLKQWVSLQLSECETMQNYVERSLSLYSKVKTAGFDINETVAGSMMLCGLTDQFRPMVMSMESAERDLTVDFVKNVLLQEVDYERCDEKALAVGYKKGKDKKKKSIKCYECKGPHFRSKCPLIKKERGAEGESKYALFSSFVARLVF